MPWRGSVLKIVVSSAETQVCRPRHYEQQRGEPPLGP
jgi:hypothetical protein